MAAHDELIAQVELGISAREFLGGKLFHSLLMDPLQTTRDAITDLPAQDAARFPALAVRRDTLHEIIFALQSLVEQGEEAGRSLAGESTGPTSRIC